MKKTSRRGFGKQFGLALGALPVLSLTTTSGQTRKRKFDGDTPITVGGGGGTRSRKREILPYVEVYFDHDSYILEGDTYDNNPLVELDYVTVGPHRYGANANSRVEIEYKRNLLNHQIVINGGGKMGVTFIQTHLPYNVAIKKHRSDGPELVSLKIGPQEIPLPSTGRVEIVAHTKLKGTKSRKRR
jgi:hypothetical protein